MSRFEERWRTLARAARGAPESPLVPLRREWSRPPGRQRGQIERPRGRLATWAPEWALPVAAVLLLYALALPAIEPAWMSLREVSNPLAAVPRAPSVPSPPVPPPPPLPRPPVTSRSTELLKDLMKEMQP